MAQKAREGGNMIGIIVTGHGGFASGLQKNVKELAGSGTKLTAIDFENGMTVDELDAKLTEGFSAYKDCDCTLVLCDLAGGTPFNRAAKLSADWPKARVISGANVPMLLEIATHDVTEEEDGDIDVDSIADELVFTGANSIVKYVHEPGDD
jgi:PTS system N-acetylgalactosamine-specific IIA component